MTKTERQAVLHAEAAKRVEAFVQRYVAVAGGFSSGEVQEVLLRRGGYPPLFTDDLFVVLTLAKSAGEVRRTALAEALKVAMLEWSGSKRTGQEREAAWRIAQAIRTLIEEKV